LDESAESTIDALQWLFLEHGPPLVLKFDNGSAFKDRDVQQMLADCGIVWLPSPPRTPCYNGGCEAGNHSMRTRTDHFARHDGRWTGASLEAARQQANELTRPEGHLNPTPSQRWTARTPISPAQREQFQATIDRHAQQVITERQGTFDSTNKNQQHQVRRQAARRALLELGLLNITRRSISLPLKRKSEPRFRRGYRWRRIRRFRRILEVQWLCD
jgi:transposase InsO family protein